MFQSKIFAHCTHRETNETNTFFFFFQRFVAPQMAKFMTALIEIALNDDDDDGEEDVKL